MQRDGFLALPYSQPYESQKPRSRVLDAATLSRIVGPVGNPLRVGICSQLVFAPRSIEGSEWNTTSKRQEMLALTDTLVTRIRNAISPDPLPQTVTVLSTPPGNEDVSEVMFDSQKISSGCWHVAVMSLPVDGTEKPLSIAGSQLKKPLAGNTSSQHTPEPLPVNIALCTTDSTSPIIEYDIQNDPTSQTGAPRVDMYLDMDTHHYFVVLNNAKVVTPTVTFLSSTPQAAAIVTVCSEFISVVLILSFSLSPTHTLYHCLSRYHILFM